MRILGQFSLGKIQNMIVGAIICNSGLVRIEWRGLINTFFCLMKELKLVLPVIKLVVNVPV